MISCCTVAAHWLSPGRRFHPCSTAGLTTVAAPAWPKLAWLPSTAAQVSPPGVLCAPILRRLQSTTLLLLPSTQPRVVTSRTIVNPGLVDVYGGSFAAYARYRPQLPFSAVLPLPNTS